jgi:uncharacterized membrane protein YGL010W
MVRATSDGGVIDEASGNATPGAQRGVDALFDRYSESHRHPTNRAIHGVCVPLIAWSLLALAWSWSPAAAYVLIGVAVAFHLTLSFPIAMGVLAVAAVMVYPLTLLDGSTLRVAIAVFAAAWIGLIVGHRIEGRKPSFLEAVRGLLVGPAWLIGRVYRRVGIVC